MSDLRFLINAQVYEGEIRELPPRNHHQSQASFMEFALEGEAFLFIYQALQMSKIAFISDRSF